MLQAVELPATITDLNTGLTDVDRDTLTHLGCISYYKAECSCDWRWVLERGLVTGGSKHQLYPGIERLVSPRTETTLWLPNTYEYEPFIYLTIISVHTPILWTEIRNTWRYICSCRRTCYIYLLPSSSCYHLEVTPAWHCNYATRVVTNVRITRVFYLIKKTYNAGHLRAREMNCTNDVYLAIRTVWTKCRVDLTKMQSISLQEMYLKTIFPKWQPFGWGHSVLQQCFSITTVLNQR